MTSSAAVRPESCARSVTRRARSGRTYGTVVTLSRSVRMPTTGSFYTVCTAFFFQAEDGIRVLYVTGVQTCALPISRRGDGSCDALIIGGGHNGLVCAAYLAGAGLKVTVLERRALVGGAAVTEEFYPGFRNSVAAYTVSLLNPKVIRELDLAGHGLRIVERRCANFLPTADGRYLLTGEGRTQAEVARFSARDAARLPEYAERLEAIAQVLRELALTTPPNVLEGSWRAALPELVRAARVGARLRRLDMSSRRELLALFAMSAGDYLDNWFESDPLKEVYGFDGIVGNDE